MAVVLDNDQLTAVQAPPGNVLVVANPGAGKTRVLVERARKLLEDGVRPSSIMAVTFTRKAAEEMKDRLKGTPGVDKMWIGTFHSLCHRILRRETKAVTQLGYRPNWTIIDTDDQEKIMSRLIREHRDGLEAYTIVSSISYRKLILDDPYNSDDENVRLLARLYQEELRRMNVMDFDDLLVNTLEMFYVVPGVVRKYGRKFKHILVDEFQDVDPCQWQILRLLNDHGSWLFAVGDPDQAIYSFRGASIGPIMQFMRDESTHVYYLHQNYRSQANVVELADSLIAHNTARIQKDQVAVRPKGRSTELYVAASDEAEALYIAAVIADLVRRGVDPKEIAILTRTSFQFQLLDRVLTRSGIPHKLVGHHGLLSLAVTKDVMACLRFAVNPADTAALERALRAAGCGIGEKTAEQIASFSRTASLADILKSSDIKLSVKAELGLRTFIDAIELIKTLGPGDAVEQAAQWLEVHEKWSGGKAILDLEQLAREFEEEAPNPTLQEFTAFISTLGQEADKKDDESGAIKIMTMHTAKGKEYQHVFLPALEDGILPHFRSRNEGHVEEERRLFYVAITRAKDALYLSWAMRRAVAGRLRLQSRSPFLDELEGDITCVNAFAGVHVS